MFSAAPGLSSGGPALGFPRERRLVALQPPLTCAKGCRALLRCHSRFWTLGVQGSQDRPCPHGTQGPETLQQPTSPSAESQAVPPRPQRPQAMPCATSLPVRALQRLYESHSPSLLLPTGSPGWSLLGQPTTSRPTHREAPPGAAPEPMPGPRLRCPSHRPHLWATEPTQHTTARPCPPGQTCPVTAHPHRPQPFRGPRKAHVPCVQAPDRHPPSGGLEPDALPGSSRRLHPSQRLLKPCQEL